ncbi:class I SAM-dependent methyltransferase [Roseobacter sp. YSTF-M11]|uniref:Class I SAM-dependent methyltransferase n=1 Tax=Roseobacter insulae TaxID=2859783 RepID=A0A9X1JYY3_9RHOB|nr:class I SAM-dependent methyltransferase [Roseobacter insulae]MBW4706664.1 class I SAM-dependent methyltransferase [Roseobacter insulae]
MGRQSKIPEPDSPDLTTRSYLLYFGSGHYDRRYPNPNITTWRRILTLLPEQAHVVDFGCGNGRYLLRLKSKVKQAAGYDINPVALEMLSERAKELGWHDLSVLGPDPTSLATYVQQKGQADLVLCLFGVLAHIESRSDRIVALQQMHDLLKPTVGRLLISVPNKARRFLAEQKQAGSGAAGLIRYTRTMDGTRVTLPYQLFDPARLTAELAEAGFQIAMIRAESVLPESLLTTYAPLRWIDSILTRMCPASLGYGLIAVAVP